MKVQNQKRKLMLRCGVLLVAIKFPGVNKRTL
jgi:hypothetical protein